MSGIYLIIAITLGFISLILGNILPASSFDNHSRDGANMSTQRQPNTNMEKDGVAFNYSSKSYAKQIMTSCQVDKNDHCLMMALNDLNKTANRQSVLGTFSDLVKLYDENNYSCHHEGHHLGMWLYDYTRNLKEVLNYITVLCGGAVYHGIFQSHFVGEQFVRNVDKNQIMITQLCPIGQENVNWLHERDCIHGMGHGLVKLYKYNTTAAVDRCNEFMPLWAQSACSRGVFMENTEYFLETGNGDFDKNDIYSPCNKTVEKFVPQCYYYYPEYNLERNNLTLGYNLTDVFTQCDNISPDKFVKFCYQGIGRMLAPFAYANPEPSIEACYRGNQSTSHDDCLIGTLKTILKSDTNADVGFNFCSHSKLDFKAVCYEIVGMWIKSFLYPSKQQLESECAKAPDVDRVIGCINANPKTSVNVPIFEPV